MRRTDAAVIVAGVAGAILLTPIRRLLGAPGMPFWALFLVWGAIVVGAFVANRGRRI